MEEEVNLMVGYFSASNHLSLLAWVFFIPLPVLMLATSMLASNLEDARSLGSKLMVPLSPLNSPDGSPPSNFMEYSSLIFQSCDLITVNADAANSARAATG